ncbi:S-methyl-5-thioribose-1-phosphate isomerase [Succinispira mobilis]|uniref:S-methyl-5-thioribose-1-phosphate isomerase n=1 Tax=Succinispira mobilis TaxID=78120 RepID=UPI0003722106|nr:S-methyl-5-thioribose-1-phosphate isomerase [Succinispira mobilis]
MKTMSWTAKQLILLDQTKLPLIEEYITCTDYQRVALAIKRLEVRGAPAIGAAAAFALVLAALELSAQQLSYSEFVNQLKNCQQEIAAARPTAVNLFWALEKTFALTATCQTVAELITALEQTALSIYQDDVQANQKIGEYGAALFTEQINILTHCNAGALATCGIGTALGVIKVAHQQHKIGMVYADETRPLLQGARLTSFELQQAGVPVTVITDNMAGWVMKNKMIQAIVVGADRIAQNGDTANKIGTYSLAVLAKEHQIPLYIAAPISTFDFSLVDGEAIPIEERSALEVQSIQGVATTPPAMPVFNPAFDVTPAAYIQGIITEYGVIQQPTAAKILAFRKQHQL